GFVFLGLYLAHGMAGALIARFALRLGFDQLSDVASFPLLLMVGQVIFLAFLPLGLVYSRYCEHEADRFGLEITRDKEAAADSFVRMEELTNPRPGLFFMLWRGTHPSDAERIEFCNDYRPWESGRPLKYGSLFRAAN